MLTIFILDDDLSLLAALNIFLPRHGFEVYTFSKSEDLLHGMYSHVPDVILLDVHLSEKKDGKSVCSILKQQYKYPNPIYLFSASTVSHADMLDCGAEGFIEKPFDMNNFLSILENAVNKP